MILHHINPTFPELITLGSVSNLWHRIIREPVLLKTALAKLSDEKIETLLFKITEPKIQVIMLSHLSDEKIYSLFEKIAKRFKEILSSYNEVLNDKEDEFQRKISDFYSKKIPELQKQIEILLYDKDYF